MLISKIIPNSRICPIYKTFTKNIGKLSSVFPIFNRSGQDFPFLDKKWLIKGDLISNCAINTTILDYKEVGQYFRKTERNFKEVFLDCFDMKLDFNSRSFKCWKINFIKYTCKKTYFRKFKNTWKN